MTIMCVLTLVLTPASFGTISAAEEYGSSSNEQESSRQLVDDDLKPLEIGTYLICNQWQAACNYTRGVERIKSIGGSAVLLSVGGSNMLYDSNYLPKMDWVASDHLKNVIDYAHSQDLKVYAWWGMPHGYWLESNPDWISLMSDGKPTSSLGSSDFYSIVPPSRVISSSGYMSQLKGVIKELVYLGFDGIDINDNFQYLYDSSFDNFTVDKFQFEIGVLVPGDTVPERASFIKSNKTLYNKWFAWRAGQLTELLRSLQQFIRDAGSEIPLRPHLMSCDCAYWDWGYDLKEISNVVDTPYLMLGFGKDSVKGTIDRWYEAGAKDVVISLYLTTIERGEEEWLAENLVWAKKAGASQIFLFTFMMASQKGLWETIGNAIDIANAGGKANLKVTGPQYGSTPKYVTSSTRFNLTVDDGEGGLLELFYGFDDEEWLKYDGNFSVSSQGSHDLRYNASGHIGWGDPAGFLEIFVDDIAPVTGFKVDEPVLDREQMFMLDGAGVELSVNDLGSGVGSTWSKLDSGPWTQYSEKITVNGIGPHRLDFYSKDNLDNVEVLHSMEIFVDTEAPISTLNVGEPQYGSWPTHVNSLTEFNITAYDQGSGVKAIYYWIDDGLPTKYSGNFSIGLPGEHEVSYRSVDWLGNEELVFSIDIFVDHVGPSSSMKIIGPNVTSGAIFVTPTSRFNISAMGGDSQVSGISYTIDDGPWIEYHGEFIITDPGEHIIKHQAIDDLDTMGMISIERVLIDDKAPESDIVVVGPSWNVSPTYVTRTSEFNLTASDGGVGVDTIWYRIDDGPWEPYRANFTITDEGVHVIYHRSMDLLGNKGEVIPFIIQTDNEPPVTSMVIEGRNLGSSPIYVVSTSRFQLTGSDIGSQVATIWFKVDDGPVMRYVGGIGPLGSGGHSISYHAVDNLGNVEVDHTRKVYIDTQGPEVSIDLVTTMIKGSTGANVTSIVLGSIDDGVGNGTIYYSFDGVAWRIYSTPLIVDHSMSLRCYSVDAFGNRGAQKVIEVGVPLIKSSDQRMPELEIALVMIVMAVIGLTALGVCLSRKHRAS